MKLEVLGTNAAFAKEGVNNSFILWDNDGLGILLDCGFSVYQALFEKGHAEKLKAVLVSHLHQDHCGSLVNLLDYRYKVLGQTTAVAGAPDDKFMFMHSGNGWEAGICLRQNDLSAKQQNCRSFCQTAVMSRRNQR